MVEEGVRRVVLSFLFLGSILVFRCFRRIVIEESLVYFFFYGYGVV